MKLVKKVPVEVINELSACVTRTAGLMYLMASAAAKSEHEPMTPPTDEEREGIMWLSFDATTALKAAAFAVGSSSDSQPEPSPKSAE